MRDWFGSLRARLLALVALGTVPILALLLYAAAEERRTAGSRAQDAALEQAHMIAAEHKHVIAGARQLLTALAEVPQIRERQRPACNRLLATMLKRFPSYSNLGVIAASGDIVCSAVALDRPVNVGDRRYFRDAVARRTFAVGDYVIGRATGKPTVTFGHPLIDASGGVGGVVFAGLDLGWLAQSLDARRLPAGASVSVLDGKGTVLVAHPARAGGPTTLVLPSNGQLEGVGEIVDADGGRRFVAYTPLLGRDAVVAVAIPAHTVLASVNRRLTRNLLGVGLVTGLMLVATWLASDVLVLRRVKQLLAATRRFGAGELGARVGGPYGSGELDRLVQAFDDMADGIGRVTEQNRLILESTAEGIYGIDLRGRVTFVNPAATRMCGYAAEELLGESMHQLIHHSRADGSPYPAEQCPSGDALSRGVTREVYDEVFWRKDGTSFPVGYVAAPVVRAGTVQGAVVAFRDVTERIRAEAQAQRQREILQQTEKVATMGSLLAGVAHELNNPLAVAMGQAMLLQETAAGSPFAARGAKIYAAAERCARIVKNFLALARNRPPERGAVALNSIVAQAVELLAYELRSSDVEVKLRLSDAVPVFQADGHQLHQVVVNLVTNAHHAMRRTAGPRRLTLASDFDAAAGRVRLTVADTGPGIPVDVQARMFEPFFTTKPPGEGTGLGLSLCRGIVEEHGGTLTVESQPGHGATFIITLPATAVVAESTVDTAARPLPVSPKTILVVDDEPEIAATLVETLEHDGHKVEVATDGVAALARVQSVDYDLIFTDTKMPRMDGPAFFRELVRRRPAFARRVVFVTGDVMDRDKRDWLESTGCLTLAKPFDVNDVRRAVHRVLSAALQTE
jgi:two-component system NtrC family sensor kinase